VGEGRAGEATGAGASLGDPSASAALQSVALKPGIGIAATFARRRVLIEKATDRLVFGPPLPPRSEARRLQKRYQQHRGSLYMFLERTAVEPTNNSFERDLRNSVTHRKVTGDHRSPADAEASAILTTARKRGQNF
jgi:hypothetical protein